MNPTAIRALFLVICTVILGLVSAWSLKEASMKNDISISMLAFVMVIVIGVNGGRFILWGYIHKHYPISFSYPINSLFFPAILVMSYVYGESVGVFQMLGVLCITTGVAVLTYGNK